MTLMIKCDCGENFTIKVNAQIIPLSYEDYLQIPCPFCKKSIELTSRNRLKIV